MALTINTHPLEVITNAPEFNVTTSLVEDATHQNLRIRATIYIGGESAAVAVLPQPKGLPAFDFFDVLKSFIGKCDAAIGGSAELIQPGVGSELLTAWTNYLSGFDTFSTSGKHLIDIQDINASGGACFSNDIGSCVVGDIYVLGLDSTWRDQGAGDIKANLNGAPGVGSLHGSVNYAGLSAGKMQANHIYFLMGEHTDSAPAINLSAEVGSNSEFDGDPTCHKISDFKNNPGIYFHVKFEEVYENVSNVATIGGESWSDTLLFIPAVVRPGETFDDFMIDEDDKKNMSRGEDGMYKFGIGQECRVLAVSPGAYIRARITTDAGVTTGTILPNLGWSLLIVNDNIGSIDAEDTDVAVDLEIMTALGGVLFIGAKTTIPCEVNCYPDIRALSFVGDLGEENVIFRGPLTEIGSTGKSFFLNQNRIRKVLKAYKRKSMVLRTVYETEGLRRLLHELIYAELPVWMYNEDFDDGFREVTVISDDTAIEDQMKLIESEIEVEYYE